MEIYFANVIPSPVVYIRSLALRPAAGWLRLRSLTETFQFSRFDSLVDAPTRAIAAERARLAQLAGVSCDVVYGSVSEELAGFAGGVQLMVVGSRGYGPVGRLLSGSTSSYLARHSACPLLVMPRSAARGRGRSGDRSDRSMQSRRSTPCLD